MSSDLELSDEKTLNIKTLLGESAAESWTQREIYSHQLDYKKREHFKLMNRAFRSTSQQPKQTNRKMLKLQNKNKQTKTNFTERRREKIKMRT